MQLLSRGSHWFPSVGLLRKLAADTDVPISFMKEVHRVVSEYLRVGDCRSARAMPKDRYMYWLQKGVAVLMVDTFEVILTSEGLSPFAKLQETLLTDSQWEALEFWLHPDLSRNYYGEAPNTLVIMSDLPLVSQRGEAEELRSMWDRTKTPARTSPQQSCFSDSGATSWSMYPQERARLLRLIFRKLKQQNVHVVFACSGAFASRTTITEKETQLSFQQVVVGPVSKSAAPVWLERAIRKIAPQSSLGDENTAALYSIEHELPMETTAPQQYGLLEVVPHPLGPSSDVKFYLQDHHEARLILGPIVGRITPRTARILIEVDRPVSSLTCTLTDPATSQR